MGPVQAGGSDQPAPLRGGLSGESRAEAEAERGKESSLLNTQNLRSGITMPSEMGGVCKSPRFRCPSTHGPGLWIGGEGHLTYVWSIVSDIMSVIFKFHHKAAIGNNNNNNKNSTN